MPPTNTTSAVRIIGSEAILALRLRRRGSAGSGHGALSMCERGGAARAGRPRPGSVGVRGMISANCALAVSGVDRRIVKKLSSVVDLGRRVGRDQFVGALDHVARRQDLQPFFIMQSLWRWRDRHRRAPAAKPFLRLKATCVAGAIMTESQHLLRLGLLGSLRTGK